MTDYIRREAGIRIVCEDCNRVFPDELCEPSDCSLLSALKAIPAADVRPVVLCKDCAHSRKGKQSLECEKHIYAWNNLNRLVNEDDFCSWGVKREES